MTLPPLTTTMCSLLLLYMQLNHLRKCWSKLVLLVKMEPEECRKMHWFHPCTMTVTIEALKRLLYRNYYWLLFLYIHSHDRSIDHHVFWKRSPFFRSLKVINRDSGGALSYRRIRIFSKGSIPLHSQRHLLRPVYYSKRLLLKFGGLSLPTWGDNR